MALIDKLNAIGDAIREKTGKQDKISLTDMPNEILSIHTGSPDVPFKYGGVNAIKLAEYETSWDLSDTSFVVGSSASTTATSILASKTDYTTSGTKTFASLTGSPTYAYGDKDIVVVQKFLTTPTHEGSNHKGEVVSVACEMVSWFTKRKTTDTSANTTRQATNASTTMCKYYNTSGVITRASASYGFYATPSTPNIASATGASTYVRVPTPVLYYRANSSYETTSNIKFVTDCLWKWKVELYVVDSASTLARVVNNDIDSLLVSGWEA